MPALSSGGRAADESVPDSETGGSASASTSTTTSSSTSSSTSGLQVPVKRFDGQNTADNKEYKKGNSKRKAKQGGEGEGEGPERLTAGGMRLRLVVLHVL